MMEQRKIEKLTKSPFHRGFLGVGHWAAAVIDGNNFPETDPFFLLMDDQLDLPGGEPVGGPHPHAGFETLTLVLKGNEKEWKTGSLELMTAGSGIVHTEEIASETKVRILQLWLVLPPEKRWTEPFFQQLLLENVPTYRSNKAEIRVYSGHSNGLVSPLQNNTPLTLVDFRMESEVEVVQKLPPYNNGFIYVIDGSVWVGDTKVEAGHTGWFDAFETSEESEVVFSTKGEGTRFVLYAAKPHRAGIVHHGPFIGDHQEDILRLYKDFRMGKMPHLNDLPERFKIRHAM